MVCDRGAVGVEVEGGEAAKDDEAWLRLGGDGGDGGDEGLNGGGAVGVAEALDDCGA